LGELQIPVAVRRNGATVVRPTAVLRVDVEPAATLLAFEPSVAARVVVEPEAPDCAFDGLGRAAAAFCVAHRCGVEFAEAISRSNRPDAPKCEDVRVVVSLSTLPRRIDLVARQLRYLEEQTRNPDAIYVSVPDWSARERQPYDVPASLVAAAAERRVVLLRSPVDWGPATKLIPVLLVETRPKTLIVTVDDDINYPPTLLAELFDGAQRHPDAAVGFRGYRLPGADGADVGHEHFVYFDSALASDDVAVDVLGGLAGIAYRSGFFDFARLTDFANWPGGAFFVDDDWIATALDEAGVARFVLRTSALAVELRESPIVAAHHVVGALNAPGHAFRNIAFQAQLLQTARRRGLFQSDYGCPVADALTDDDELRRVLADVDARLCGGQRRAGVFVVETDVGWQTTVGYDRFVAHHAPQSGAFRGASTRLATADDVGASLSARAAVVHGDAAKFLWDLALEAPHADLVHLGGGDLPGQLTAAFASGLVDRAGGATLLAMTLAGGSPEEMYFEALFRNFGCARVTRGKRFQSWRCARNAAPRDA